MNRATPAVSATQPVAEWRPEHRQPRDAQPSLATARSAPTALASGSPPGRMLDVELGMLLDALPAGPAGAASNPAARLGSVAQLISRLLAESGHADPIRTTVPLATIPGDTSRITSRLQDTFRLSGLFYESHLADWVAGKGSKAQLLREPQAALGGASSQAPALPAAEPDDGAARLPPQAEALILRQLDVLEQRSAAWQGQVWPGQEAELRIAQEERDAQDNVEPVWQATLKLSFPGLGPIEAQIDLCGRSTRLVLRAADPDASRKLQAARSDLRRALDERGLLLADAAVSHSDGNAPTNGVGHAGVGHAARA